MDVVRERVKGITGGMEASHEGKKGKNFYFG
jgi:hypothetical protein